MQERWRLALLSRPGAERLAMGCDMFDDAKRLALAGLRAQNPGTTDAELKGLLLVRLYGQGFAPETMSKILGRLAALDRRRAD